MTRPCARFTRSVRVMDCSFGGPLRFHTERQILPRWYLPRRGLRRLDSPDRIFYASLAQPGTQSGIVAKNSEQQMLQRDLGSCEGACFEPGEEDRLECI